MHASTPHEWPADIGERIQRARVWIGWSREVFEEESGISLNTLSKLEQCGQGSARLIGRVVEVLDDHLRAIGQPTISTEPVQNAAEYPDGLCLPTRNWNWGIISPGAMLDPRYRFVPFHGRGAKEELPALLKWCQEPGQYALKAYAASGGTGKTRLALELCEQLRLLNWEAGFLRGQSFPEERHVDTILSNSSRPLLVVADYAASPENMTALQRLIPQLPGSRRPRVCLLMLERDSLWLGRLRRAKEVNDILDGAMVVTGDLELGLRSIDRQPEARNESFRLAAQAFHRTLPGKQKKKALPKGPPNPASRIYDQVFYLHALAHEMVTGAGEESPTKLAIVRRTLARERGYWKNMLAARGLPGHLLQPLESAVELLGRKGGAETIPQAVDWLRQLPGFADLPLHMTTQVAMALRESYPDEGVGIAPLQPDLLKQCLADEWLALRARVPSQA